MAYVQTMVGIFVDLRPETEADWLALRQLLREPRSVGVLSRQDKAPDETHQD